MSKLAPLTVLALGFAACGDPPSPGAAIDAAGDGGLAVDAAVDAAPYDGPSPLVVDRPYDLYVPTGYQAGTPTPLVVMLHGYSATAALQEVFFQLRSTAEAQGFLYARPEGTVGPGGLRFWNATDACCDFGDSGVDDVAYLRAVIDDVAGRYTVDPRRVFVVGHSNGGFMAHRLACDAADRVAAIVSVAGATWADPARCAPSRPVAILQVHGTLDAVIAYGGGQVVGADGPYPAAVTTAASWRGKNACPAHAAGGRLDLVADLLGDETTIDRASGCAGGAVELWTMAAASHLPTVKQPEFADAIWGFFAAHPRP